MPAADDMLAAIRASAMLDAIAHGLLIADARQPERPLVFANGLFTQLTGYESAAVLGRTVLLLAGPDSDPLVAQALRAALGAAQQFAAEWRIQRHDGSSLWARISTRPLLDDDGSAAFVVISIEDISRYKEARESLRTSEARLQVAMAASELSMWDWHVERDEIYYNDQWRESLGVDPGELVCRAELSDRLLLPADEPAVLERFEQHFHGRTSHFESEYQLPLRHGATKWFHAYAKATRRDTEGKPQRVIGVLRDITSRKQQMQEVLEIGRRWERAVRGTSDGLYDWNLLTGHVWYAARFRAILGYDERELPDTFLSFQGILHPEDRSLVMTRIRAHLENQEPLDVRCRVTKRNGNALWCRLRGEAERDAAGRPVRLAGSLSDIDAQIEAERALIQSQKMDAVGRLTGGIAHDFNNLLSVVVGNMQLLARSLKETPRLLRQAESAIGAAMRGADLTRRLLAFARQQQLEPRIIDPNALISGMFELLRRILGEVEIVSRLDPHVWPTKADPSQLENTILNLVINARDATPAGGIITLATRNVTIASQPRRAAQEDGLPPGEYAVLDVVDTGAGMSAETLKRVFEPFFTTKDVGKGTGLGLSIVYGFVQQSGGHVEIESAPGRGTSVHVYLPRAHARPEQLIVSAPSGAELPHGDETILVVEDDAQVRRTALDLLASLGYRVLDAATGHQALERFMQHPQIALVFSDVMLPGGMLGTQLVHRLMERRPAPKVLMTSGFSASGIMHRGLLDGSMELLPKPYRLEDLAHRVRAQLDGKQEGTSVSA